MAAFHVEWFDVYEGSIQLLDFQASMIHNVNQNNGHWTIELRGLSASPSALSTVGNLANTRERERITLAGVFADPWLHFVLSPQGSNPGVFSGSVAVRYQFVRV
ncbi:MAG: hypothetical protein HC895_27390 [Leptolyngbyaceae cyanobacterium SM1_3_5]|nr:hypothetical protein [Leptolyngbyaceae cyanobacterium SM1_3_5]